MKISRVANARRQITNTIFGTASVDVALRATSAGLVKVALSIGKRLQWTRSDMRILQAS
jgi:hypothetical protein